MYVLKGIPSILHIKVCLQVLGSCTAYVKTSVESFFVLSTFPQVVSLESVSVRTEDYKFENEVTLPRPGSYKSIFSDSNRSSSEWSDKYLYMSEINILIIAMFPVDCVTGSKINTWKVPHAGNVGRCFFIFNQNIHVIKNYSESHYRTFDSDSRCIQVHFVNSELFIWMVTKVI